MEHKVIYKTGKKAEYMELPEYDPNVLYYLDDARELRKGADLYSDGLRRVDNFDALPDFLEAADGVLYVCEDTDNGYVLNDARDDWDIVFHGVDGETIGFNESGLLSVKSVPIQSVTGLSDRLDTIEQAIGGVTVVPIASSDVAGIVKPNADEFAVTEDGTLSILKVDASKISGLTGDGNTSFDPEQFDVIGGVVSIKRIGTDLIMHNDKQLDDVLAGVIDSTTWEQF